MSEHLNPDQFREYTKHYNRGWNSSKNSKGSGFGPSALERADMRGEVDAWYDGYSDHGVGRDKYALRGHRFGTGERIEGY